MSSKEDQATQEGEARNLHSLQFPWKLHRLLEETDRNGDNDIISWLPGYKAFKVHNRLEFAARIMPAYFSSAKYKTFQRSLNLWGFESVSKGRDKGACFHKFFVRGHPNLCEHMRRVKIKGQQATAAKSKDAVPSLLVPPEAASSEKPAVSDYIRRRRSDFDNPSASADHFAAPRLSLLESDLFLKAAYERQRRKAFLRMHLQHTIPSLNLGPLSSLMSSASGLQGLENADPLQTVVLAAHLASKVIHEV
jgi:hypothetical protein